MSELTTDKPVNTYQLALDHPNVPFRSVRHEGSTTIRSDLSQSALERAVADHEADWEVVPPDEAPEPTPEERLAGLEVEVRGIKERAAQASEKASNTDAKNVGRAVAGDG